MQINCLVILLHFVNINLNYILTRSHKYFQIE